MKIKEWDVSLNGISQWGSILKFSTRKDYNWIDFSPIWINIEYGGYKGRYFEFVLIIMGLGFSFEVYHKEEREKFIAPLMAMVDEWKEENNEL